MVEERAPRRPRRRAPAEVVVALAPDPRRSYAVLIGTSTFASAGLADLPAVAGNLTGLAGVLTDPALAGSAITVHRPGATRVRRPRRGHPAHLLGRPRRARAGR